MRIARLRTERFCDELLGIGLLDRGLAVGRLVLAIDSVDLDKPKLLLLGDFRERLAGIPRLFHNVHALIEQLRGPLRGKLVATCSFTPSNVLSSPA